MSIVVTATLDLSQLTTYTEDMQKQLQDISGPLLEGVNALLIPQLRTNASTDWNVRTGRYSSSLIAGILDPNSVQVTMYAPYSLPLERGWRMKKGGQHAGKHTLQRTMEDSMPAIMGYLMDILFEQ